MYYDRTFDVVTPDGDDVDFEVRLGVFNDTLYQTTIPSWGGTEESDFISHNFELMQYTGLKDKNGVEIFEGDIVSRGIGKPWVMGKGLSFFQDVADMGRFLERGDPYVVIGNMYQNPELLGGTNGR